MPKEKLFSQFDFLRGKPALAVSGLLLLEIALFNGIPTKEILPSPPPLGQFDSTVGPWLEVGQYAIDPDQLVFLKADDTLARTYKGPDQIDLFVAFYKSQRAGVATHSPKVCLPGNGWTPESSAIISIEIPGTNTSIPVNRYVVRHDDDRNLVLYWYENPYRVMANEYLSKFYLIVDSLRYHRSDEAMIRVITDLSGKVEATAEAHAIQFVQDVYGPLKQHMWTDAAGAGLRPQPLPQHWAVIASPVR